MKRTYYDMEFEPDSIEFDGDHRGTPLAVTVRYMEPAGGTKSGSVLLDTDQVQNLIQFLSAWAEQNPSPLKRKWSDE